MAFAGANASIYPIMQATAVDIGSNIDFLQPSGQRVYLNTTTKDPGPIPAAWPQLSDPTARACVSIRPDPQAVLSTSLDAALKQFLTSAPAGAPSLLGLWHEASTQDYPINPEDLTAAQSYIQALAWKVDANVKVGAIENATITQELSVTWMAPNLDFYCCDIYDNRPGTTVPSSQLDSFLGYCNALMSPGKVATIGVTEANSRFPGRRPYWFTAVWSWLVSHGYTGNDTCFLTYWLDTGPESGAWIDDDWATIDALYAIFAEAAP